MGALRHNRFSKHSLLTVFSQFLKVSEVCNISSKCLLANKPAKKIFLHKTPYTPPLFQKKICALHHRIVSKHPLFIPFLLVLTVCYISYKYQPPNNWAKHQYFYTRDFISLHHLEKNFALSIAKVFRNNHFLPVFP